MARLDTGWHAHPKILKLGLAAMGLHAWSISYCDHTLSDGFIPLGSWPALPGVAACVRALVAAGMWEPAVQGYWLHDYGDYNRTRAHVESLRVARRAAGQAGGQAKALANARANGKQTEEQTNEQMLKQMLKQKASPGPGPGDVTSSSSSVRNSGSSPEVSGTSGARDTDPALLAEHLERLARERLQRQTTTTNF